MWNICLPAPERRCPGHGEQGLYLLQVRTVPGSETGKIKGRKERREVGKMGGKRKDGEQRRGRIRKSTPLPPKKRGVRARVLEAEAVKEGFLEETALGRMDGKDCSWEN